MDNSALYYQQQQDQQARADETARQARIAQGRTQIDRLFDRGQTLISPETSAVVPSNDPEKIQQAWNTYRTSGLIQQPTETVVTPAQWSDPGSVPAFDDKFYNQRKQAYIDNYTPQLQDQFQKARENMAYALSRASLTRSSVATDQVARLNEANLVQANTIGSQAEADVNKLRTNVEDQRANLVSQLQASADPGGTANLALARTQSLRDAPVTYSPLGDVFNGIASGIGHFVQGAQTASYLSRYPLLQPANAPSATAGGGQGSRTVN
jgi:hypothetical protein